MHAQENARATLQPNKEILKLQKPPALTFLGKKVKYMKLHTH